MVQLLRVQSLGVTEEYLLMASMAADQLLDAEVTEKLLTLPGRAEALANISSPSDGRVRRAAPGEGVSDSAAQSTLDFTAAHVALPVSLQQELARQKMVVIGGIEKRNLALFADETEKLDAWADDLKVALEREIKELDRRIKETRTKSKGAATLAEKLAAQKEQRELEGQRDKKRRELFARQDEIQAKRDKLIDELESQLQQHVQSSTVLACQWMMQ